MTTFPKLAEEDLDTIIGNSATENERSVAKSVSMHYNKFSDSDLESLDSFKLAWAKIVSMELPQISLERAMQITKDILRYRQRLVAACG